MLLRVLKYMPRLMLCFYMCFVVTKIGGKKKAFLNINHISSDLISFVTIYDMVPEVNIV